MTQKTTRNKPFIDTSLFQIKSDTEVISFGALFLPVLVQYLLTNLLGTVDTAILSNVAENAVGAVGAANQMITMFNIMTTIICTGASSVVNNFHGAKKSVEVKEASFTAIALCCTIGLVVGLLMSIFRYEAVGFMNLPGEMMEYGVIYFSIRCVFLVIPVASQILNTLMSTYGMATPGVVSGLLSNVINLIGTYAAVTLLAGNTNHMIAGAAAASVFSQVVGLLLQVFIFCKKRIPLGVPNIKQALGYIKRILLVGGPGGISQIAYNAAQTLTVSFVALLGDAALNGKVYFATTTSYCYMLSFAMGNAAAVLIGRYAGAGEYEKANKFSKQVWKIAALVNLVSSLVLFTFRKSILGLFTSDVEILLMASVILLIDLYIEQMRAVSHIYERALVSTGDSLFIMPITVLSGLVNGVGLAYILAIPLELGLTGVWLGLAVDETVRTAATFFRWKSGKWQQKSRNILQ